MRRIIERRPKAAIVIALLALFAALGGSVYAGSKISGKTVKKGSLPGNRVKADSITGKQINEAKLGVVPSAGELAGTFRTDLVNANAGQTVPLLSLSTFSIEGQCLAATATVIMNTTVNGASATGNGGELDNSNFNVGDDLAISYPADLGTNHVAFYGDTEFSGWSALTPGGAEIFRGYAYAAKDQLGAPCSFMVHGERLK